MRARLSSSSKWRVPTGRTFAREAFLTLVACVSLDACTGDQEVTGPDSDGPSVSLALEGPAIKRYASPEEGRVEWKRFVVRGKKSDRGSCSYGMRESLREGESHTDWAIAADTSTCVLLMARGPYVEPPARALAPTVNEPRAYFTVEDGGQTANTTTLNYYPTQPVVGTSYAEQSLWMSHAGGFRVIISDRNSTTWDYRTDCAAKVTTLHIWARHPDYPSWRARNATTRHNGSCGVRAFTWSHFEARGGCWFEDSEYVEFHNTVFVFGNGLKDFDWFFEDGTSCAYSFQRSAI